MERRAKLFMKRFYSQQEGSLANSFRAVPMQSPVMTMQSNDGSNWFCSFVWCTQSIMASQRMNIGAAPGCLLGEGSKMAKCHAEHCASQNHGGGGGCHLPELIKESVP